MLDNSVFLENCGGGGGSASDGVAVDFRNDGGRGGGGEDGDRNSAGNRWPSDETLALLKIRSDMDQAFRDSALKAPLWDEVSRKLGELGYSRSAKKCKEKFENIFKYHKRTKEGRSSRVNGKNYRFFEQLELLDTQFSVPSTPLNQVPSYAMEKMAMSTPTPTAAVVVNPINSCHDFTVPSSKQDHDSEFTSTSTSSASSLEKGSGRSFKKKRKLADYFERLMKDVLEKQQDLQNKFLEAIEKCEKDQIAREEAWKTQEMARIKREQEFLAQERAMTAAKDAALLAFLQKISKHTFPLQMPETVTTIFDKLSNKQENILEKQIRSQENSVGTTFTYNDKQDNSGGENSIQTSSSRWPKTEVEALIMFKTDLDLKYQDSGPKGPLWEEISSCMKKLGYDRSAKRCKEKWENINKYYKRVKDSNKKRTEDSKTCPYFNMLESLYAKKSKKIEHGSENSGLMLKPEQILMQMIGHQFQGQPPAPPQLEAEYGGNDHQYQEEEEDEHDDNGGDNYQIVTNNSASAATLG